MSIRSHDLLMAGFWTAGLLAMAVADPHAAPLADICPFDALGDFLGLSFCPGCGLGHSVAFLVRGAWEESFQAHPLAIPAVAFLAFHVAGLVRPHTPSRRRCRK